MIIAQISDPHIDDDGSEAAISHDANLQRAVNQLLQLPALPDVVIVSGDITNHGRPTQYARFQELIRPLTMPVYVIPGNHDNREVMLQLFGAQGTQPLAGFVQYVVDPDPVRLIALDTNAPGKDAGELDNRRLQWLEERLAEAPAKPTLIFMHHPPFVTGMSVFDGMGLSGADTLGMIIERHPQVERIVAGHLHAAMLARFHGTIAQTCASLAETMVIDVNQPTKLVAIDQPPTFLLHVWQPGAGLFTYTCLIGDHGPALMIHDGTQWVG